MSDRIPGSSPFNPIKVGSWNINLGPGLDPICDFEFWHDDFDGAPDANDKRCGYGPSEQNCREQIADWCEEHPDDV